MSSTRPGRGDGAPLTDKLLTAIAHHLIRNHHEDLLACAKASDLDWAEQVRDISLDPAGITLEVEGNDQVQTLRIDFPEPAKGILAFKRILGAIITESRAQLGWPTADDKM